MNTHSFKKIGTAGIVSAGLMAVFASGSFAAQSQRMGDALLNGVMVTGMPTRPYTPVDCIIHMKDNISWMFANGVVGDSAGTLKFRSDLCADADHDGFGTATIGGGSAFSRIPVAAPALRDVGIAGDMVRQERFSRTSNVLVPAAVDYTLGAGPSIFPAPLVETGLGAAIPNVPPISPQPVPPAGPLFGPVDVGVGATVSLNMPGVYQGLTLNSGGTLRITVAGTYVFDWVMTTGGGAQLAIDVPDVTIISKGGTSFGHPTNVNPANTPRFIFYTLGADGGPDPATQRNPLSSSTGLNAAFFFAGDRSLNVCLNWVGNGTTIIRGNSQMIARFQGENFEKTTLNVTLTHPQDDCGLQAACACINELSCDGNGNVVARGDGVDLTNWTLFLATDAALGQSSLLDPSVAGLSSGSSPVESTTLGVVVDPAAGTITAPVSAFDNGLPVDEPLRLLDVCSTGIPPVAGPGHELSQSTIRIVNGRCTP